MKCKNGSKVKSKSKPLKKIKTCFTKICCPTSWFKSRRKKTKNCNLSSCVCQENTNCTQAKEKWKQEFHTLRNFGSCDSSVSLLLDMEVKVVDSCTFSSVEQRRHEKLTEISGNWKYLSPHPEEGKCNKIEINNNYVCEKPPSNKSSSSCIDDDENSGSNIPSIISSIHNYCTRETCHGMK